ncbi:Wzz/FepE/Etk N-terminal domain-containing protein [Mucilaginibacter paludis]|uniref:Lipopolysaccharide biosynthesis protein n=1 Tax=Mucilaginibacter paludis DSM 18603 TaxID=714943 RepID=H1XZP5_9SPHI|nr:Wzz/FepE/Etk N-terminal domain-containing protein [Mucilaginibacter paludis]EHQ27737.1 lipopolysaccharide biosynthesis protein [Mucilaginibacter paludis DSM 18603]
MDKPVNIQETKNTKDDEISLKELILKFQEWWRYLLSKWVTILIAGIIGGALGFTYAYFKKPIYKAELSFALEDDKAGGLGGAAGLASQFGFDLGGSGGGAFSGDNLLELMKSRSMVEKTLLTPVNIKGKDETLAELYISFNKLRKGWENKPELKKIQFTPGANRAEFSLQQDSVLGTFYNAITKSNLSVAKTDKKLSIVNIAVNSENELFSKYFVEILAKTVSDFYIATKTKKSVQNVSILQHQTDSVRRELNAAIYGVASSIDATPNANPGRQILRTPSQHRQVDVQANQAILTELVKNLEVSKVSLRKETPLIQVIDRPILPLEKEKSGKLKGLLIGGITLSFLTVLVLLVKRLFKTIMS